MYSSTLARLSGSRGYQCSGTSYLVARYFKMASLEQRHTGVRIYLRAEDVGPAGRKVLLDPQNTTGGPPAECVCVCVHVYLSVSVKLPSTITGTFFMGFSLVNSDVWFSPAHKQTDLRSETHPGGRQTVWTNRRAQTHEAHSHWPFVLSIKPQRTSSSTKVTVPFLHLLLSLSVAK